MKKRAFSLVEIVVVMGIITLLSGLMVAAISGARRESRNSKRLNDARTFKIALETYLLNNRKYPVGCGSGGSRDIYRKDCWSGAPEPPARIQLEPYLKNFPDLDPSGTNNGRVRYCAENTQAGKKYGLYVVQEPRNPGDVGWDGTTCYFSTLTLADKSNIINLDSD